MEATRARPQLPVGSAQWLLEETQLANGFVVQEVEEFAFSARNEMEWLNEHMSGIFNLSKFDMAETFKTPGKLRGKTPRTARKRDQTDSRAPLSDLFSANRIVAASPTRKNVYGKQTTHFQVAEDHEDAQTVESSQQQSRFSFDLGKENTDSGYHDMTEDEMDVEATVVNRAVQQPSSPHKPQFVVAVPSKLASPRPLPLEPTSFSEASQKPTASAAERSAHPDPPLAADHLRSDIETPQESLNDAQLRPQQVAQPDHTISGQSNQYSIAASTAAPIQDPLEKTDRSSPQRQSIDSEIGSSSSESSTPRTSVIRKKSSLTFASLPAREPLTAKKSVGTRQSQADHSRANFSTRESQFGKPHSAKPAADAQIQHHHQTPIDSKSVGDKSLATEDVDADTLNFNDVSESTKKHNKSSTQRLQERFAMLGKTSTSRASKSISASAAMSQSQLPPSTMETVHPHKTSLANETNEESWIGPAASYPPVSTTSTTAEKQTEALTSTQNLDKPVNDTRHVTEEQERQKPLAASLSESDQALAALKHLSYPELPELTNDSENKASFSESIWNDGPISASKAKLFSVLKSAKGIFASSANVSAQAKIEAAQSQPRDVASTQADAAPATSTSKLPQNIGFELVKTQASKVELQEQPKSKDIANTEPAARDEAAQETETVKQMKEAEDLRSTDQQEPDRSREDSVPAPPPPPKQPSSMSQMQKNGDLRRPNKAGKETAQKTRPAPVPIRLASQKIGQTAHSTTNSTVGQQEQGPPVPPKQSMLSKKASNSSLHTTSSTQSFKSAATANSSRPKALEAAARKKEQDEKEAQRKAEQKREMEKRRAAKVEEERRQLQEQKASEQRALELKQQAQKQALEQRKADAAARRAEQQKAQAATSAASRQKAVDEQNHATQTDQRSTIQSSTRNEAATIRPVSRMGTNQDFPPVPHINPAKPPKRQFNPDVHDDNTQKPLPLRPDEESSKRRKTNRDSFVEVVSRPAMAPPVRPSMMRKDPPSRPTQGLTGLSNTLHSQAPSMKGTLQNLPQQNAKTPHMNDLAKFSNARIPFAEAPNPPQSGPMPAPIQQQLQQSQPQRTYQPTKTPTSTVKTMAPVPPKSSPNYPNGDSIELPDIATESEDSDDDNDFEAPDWTQSPALRELLKEQQLVDPSKIFGPIGPIMMEEVFKGNKERLARFRSRTSSANWNGPDRLTEEERRKDREAREKLERKGAWTFSPSAP